MAIGTKLSPAGPVVTTPIGDVTLVATGPALTGVYFAHHWYQPTVLAHVLRAEQP